jgi:hypothetical protein
LKFRQNEKNKKIKKIKRGSSVHKIPFCLKNNRQSLERNFFVFFQKFLPHLEYGFSLVASFNLILFFII